jgi:hypothetical protein
MDSGSGCKCAVIERVVVPRDELPEPRDEGGLIKRASPAMSTRTELELIRSAVCGATVHDAGGQAPESAIEEDCSACKITGGPRGRRDDCPYCYGLGVLRGDRRRRARRG